MSPRKNKSLNLKKVCRTCLSEKSELKSIFEACVPDMLMSCTSVQVTEDDGLPSQICIQCLRLINRFHSFKEKVKKSDQTLRKYITKNDICTNAKTENCNELEVLNNESDDEYIPPKTSEKPAVIHENRRILRKRTHPQKSRAISLKKTKRLKLKTKTSEKIEQAEISTVQNENKLENTLQLENANQTLPKEKVNVIKNDEILELKHENVLELKNSNSIQISNIFIDGPPPLVPLVPIALEQIPAFPVDKTVPPAELALAPISTDTPPLIPIKPISGIDPEVLSTVYRTETVLPKLLCNACDEEFTDPIALKNHAVSHGDSYPLACNICKKEFANKRRLIGHLKGHMVVKHYACRICSKRYPNPSTFKVHMRTHTGERPFKCQICNKGFIRWAGVVSHMKSHNSVKPYLCEICDKGFKIQSNLERHKVLHTGSMPFCCSYCGKTFSQSDNLQLHIRTYHTHERPYLCSECGKGFVSSTRLNRHMWVHTGFKPYACQMCSKAYSNSNDLKNHEKIHSGGPKDSDKPYPCNACDMRFFHPCRLAKHMKTHERPYVCTECPRTFSREDVLNKHIVNKHGETPQSQIPTATTQEFFIYTD